VVVGRGPAFSAEAHDCEAGVVDVSIEDRRDAVLGELLAVIAHPAAVTRTSDEMNAVIGKATVLFMVPCQQSSRPHAAYDT
jgi:hypothetical protein